MENVKQPAVLDGNMPKNNSVKPGTHCGVCGEPTGGSHPGADVFHMTCLLETERFKQLLIGPEADRRRAGRRA